MKFKEYLECTRRSLYESNSSSTKVQPKNRKELVKLIRNTIEKEDGRELDDDNEDDDCDVDRIVGNYHYCQGDKEPDAHY